MSRNDPSHDDSEGYAIAKRTDSEMLDTVLVDLMHDCIEGRNDTALILLREAFNRGMGDMGVESWGMFDHGNFPNPCDISCVAALRAVRDGVMDMARADITSL